jgi:sugar (pentulose or hexulose) kinase
VGTSGIRAVALDADAVVVASAALPLPPPDYNGAWAEQSAVVWRAHLFALMDKISAVVKGLPVRALSLDATSGTLLLCNAAGRPLDNALMYNDARAEREAARIGEVAPRESAAHGASSGLAKWLWWRSHRNTAGTRYVLNQADWLVGELTGHYGHSDENNCVKLGYDAQARGWPAWLDALHIPREQLPLVHTPGTEIAPLRGDLAQRWGFLQPVAVLAGTTDSTAAILATGASEPGEAVTSLGSTLVLKVLAEKPIFSPEYGIYSQPLRNRWLVGGGSNCGGATLRLLFTDEQIAAMTPMLDPDTPTGLDYYPLPSVGERFPVCDPAMQPRLTPRPADDIRYFQGILESLARIELQGYQRIRDLGAPYPRKVLSAGGGAANPAWTRIRQRLLGVPLVTPAHQDAAYGTASLLLPYLRLLNTSP